MDGKTPKSKNVQALKLTKVDLMFKLIIVNHPFSMYGKLPFLFYRENKMGLVMTEFLWRTKIGWIEHFIEYKNIYIFFY